MILTLGLWSAPRLPQSLHWADLMVLAADLFPPRPPPPLYNEHLATLVREELEDPEPSQP